MIAVPKPSNMPGASTAQPSTLCRLDAPFSAISSLQNLSKNHSLKGPATTPSDILDTQVAQVYTRALQSSAYHTQLA